MSTETAGGPLRLRALLGDYPGTHALRSGQLQSPLVSLDFADVKTPNHAFKRVVQDLEFDVAELAVVTYLMARAHGKPLVLLPVVVVSRYQHPFLVYNTARGPLRPEDLAGKRVGIRAYSVTTATWMRGILADDHGVDSDHVRWVTFEDAHVAEFNDPPNAERAPAGSDMARMLLDGELDAAVLGGKPDDPRLQTLIPDPEAAARAWRERTGALQINHMVTVSASLVQRQPQAVREVYRLLVESKAKAAGLSSATIDYFPTGINVIRHSLEVAIDCVYRQKLIPRRYAVDELFDDATRFP